MNFSPELAGEAHFGGKTVVNCNVLNDFCKKKKINNIDILKIDIEGAEFSVLEKSKNFIKKNVGYMIIELNSTQILKIENKKINDLLKIIKSIFNNVFLIHRISGELWPLNKYDDLTVIPGIYNVPPLDLVQDLVCFN